VNEIRDGKRALYEGFEVGLDLLDTASEGGGIC